MIASKKTRQKFVQKLQNMSGCSILSYGDNIVSEWLHGERFLFRRSHVRGAFLARSVTRSGEPILVLSSFGLSGSKAARDLSHQI
jgi:hypothetical protein